MITADPAASAATMPPTGMATGKFHGGDTTVTRLGVNAMPGSSAMARADAA